MFRRRLGANVAPVISLQREVQDMELAPPAPDPCAPRPLRRWPSLRRAWTLPGKAENDQERSVGCGGFSLTKGTGEVPYGGSLLTCAAAYSAPLREVAVQRIN